MVMVISLGSMFRCCSRPGAAPINESYKGSTSLAAFVFGFAFSFAFAYAFVFAFGFAFAFGFGFGFGFGLAVAFFVPFDCGARNISKMGCILLT